MSCRNNRFIKRALKMSNQLSALADEGEARSEDDGCAVLYGVIRDCAYRIRQRAEQEKENHRRSGMWDEAEEPEWREGNQAADTATMT
jgi:hypothetical protein